MLMLFSRFYLSTSKTQCLSVFFYIFLFWKCKISLSSKILLKSAREIGPGTGIVKNYLFIAPVDTFYQLRAWRLRR